MFTRENFYKQVRELRDVESRMVTEYNEIINLLDDDDLKLKFTSLLQEEHKHADNLRKLEDICHNSSTISIPFVKWSIGRKISILLVVSISLLTGIHIYSLYKSRDAMRIMDDISTVDTPLLMAIVNMQQTFSDQHILAYKVIGLVHGEPDFKNNLEQCFNLYKEHTSQMEEYFAECHNIISNGEFSSRKVRLSHVKMLNSIAQLKDRSLDFDKECLKIIQSRRLDNKELSIGVISSLAAKAAIFKEHSNGLVHSVVRFVQDASREIVGQGYLTMRNHMIMLLAAWGIIIFLFMFIVLRMIRNIKKLSFGAQQIASGFASGEIYKTDLNIGSSDEIGALGSLLKIMVDVFSDNFNRRHRLENELDLLATTDPLTGAINRRKCDEILDKEISRSKRYGTPMSVIMLDIDNFREINNKIGHEQGDNIIVEIANIIKCSIRDSDTLFRYGGEEFLVLASNTNISGAMLLAEKLQVAIAQNKFQLIDIVTVSMGVTEMKNSDSVREILHRVDDGLYKAKIGGRDRTFSI